MKYKEKQEKFIPEILKLLKDKEHGMIATEIKEQINHELSRNTIQSYLDQLKAEKKVYSVKIGRYELWFHKKQKESKIEIRQDLANHPIFPFLLTFLDHLQDSPANNAIDWKKIGLEIGNNFGFKPYFPNLSYFVVKGQSGLDMLNISQDIYPSILGQVLIYLGDEDFVIDPPIIQKEINNIIFRIRGSKYSKNKIFFNLLCGIEEAEMIRELRFPVKVDVLQQITDKNIVDINMSFPTMKREKKENS